MNSAHAALARQPASAVAWRQRASQCGSHAHQRANAHSSEQHDEQRADDDEGQARALVRGGRLSARVWVAAGAGAGVAAVVVALGAIVVVAGGCVAVVAGAASPCS